MEKHGFVGKLAAHGFFYPRYLWVESLGIVGKSAVHCVDVQVRSMTAELGQIFTRNAVRDVTSVSCHVLSCLYVCMSVCLYACMPVFLYVALSFDELTSL